MLITSCAFIQFSSDHPLKLSAFQKGGCSAINWRQMDPVTRQPDARPSYQATWRQTQLPGYGTARPSYQATWRQTQLPGYGTARPSYQATWPQTQLPGNLTPDPVTRLRDCQTQLPGYGTARPSYLATGQPDASYDCAKAMQEEECQILTTLFLILYPRLWALSIKSLSSPRVGAQFLMH